MLTLKQQMQSYGAYHRDPHNKLTHFFGVPLVTFSLFLFLGWFRFVHPEVPADHGGHALLPRGHGLLLPAGLDDRPGPAPVHADPPVAGGLGREAVHGALVLGVPDDLRARVDHPARRPRRSRGGGRPWRTTSSRSSTPRCSSTVEALALMGFRKDLAEPEPVAELAGAAGVGSPAGSR